MAVGKVWYGAKYSDRLWESFPHQARHFFDNVRCSIPTHAQRANYFASELFQAFSLNIPTLISITLCLKEFISSKFNSLHSGNDSKLRQRVVFCFFYYNFFTQLEQNQEDYRNLSFSIPIFPKLEKNRSTFYPI